jgi:para-nitrobenzyl esterase
VVVTVEYRLNLMGWLAHPALDSEGHNFGNYGILDQQFALQWVQANIANFGGNPANVTVGGQSAGAEDTGIAMLSPLSKGLFSKGLCESFCPSSNLPTLQTAEAAGLAFAQAAGCGSGTGAKVAACLRALPASVVESLAGTASTSSAFIQGPMVDGTVIPAQPIPAFTAGNFNHVPLINGNVEDEENFTLAITEFFEKPRVAITAAQYQNFVATTFATPTFPSGTIAKVLKQYPLSNFATPQLAFDRAGTDMGICAEALSIKSWGRKFLCTLTSSTTRRHPSTSQRCRASPRLPITPPIFSICSQAGAAAPSRQASCTRSMPSKRISPTSSLRRGRTSPPPAIRMG